MLAACVGRAMGDFCLSYMSTEEAILGGGLDGGRGRVTQNHLVFTEVWLQDPFWRLKRIFRYSCGDLSVQKCRWSK